MVDIKRRSFLGLLAMLVSAAKTVASAPKTYSDAAAMRNRDLLRIDDYAGASANITLRAQPASIMPCYITYVSNPKAAVLPIRTPLPPMKWRKVNNG